MDTLFEQSRNYTLGDPELDLIGDLDCNEVATNGVDTAEKNQFPDTVGGWPWQHPAATTIFVGIIFD